MMFNYRTYETQLLSRKTLPDFRQTFVFWAKKCLSCESIVQLLSFV